MSTWRPIGPLPLWKRCLPELLHGPVRLCFQTGLIGLILFSGFAFYYFILATRFDLNEVAKLPTGTLFYDRNGEEIVVPGVSGRRLVERADIPDFLVKSLMAREDARFFEHHGVDLRGLARATLRNLKDRDFTQGASTLSMQLARNSFEIREKSLHRKFLEIALTYRVEARYSKDEILTHYLNRIYFGAGAYGIEQAARTYFGKPTRELTDAECALLAGIIRGPHIFSPLRKPEAALEQRRQTLHRIFSMGFINAARRDALAAEPLKLAKAQPAGNQTSYVLQAVERELERILETSHISPDGIHIHTTIDMGWQRRLETELNHAVEALEKEKNWQHPPPTHHQPGEETSYLQYAAITTETRSGAILALIGGRNFNHSSMDRTHATRDLGSAFEPFVAAAAAERGKLVLPGRPVQTGRQIGAAEVERLAKRVGFRGPFGEEDDLFRGSVAATPRQMSLGLATLGNKGKRPKTYFIQEIRDGTGEVLFRTEPQQTPALSANAALDAVSVLSQKNGTRTFTGATGSERDAWTLRLGPSGSTAIWIGFDQPTRIAPEPRLKSLLDEFVTRLDNK